MPNSESLAPNPSLDALSGDLGRLLWALGLLIWKMEPTGLQHKAWALCLDLESLHLIVVLVEAPQPSCWGAPHQIANSTRPGGLKGAVIPGMSGRSSSSLQIPLSS